MAEGSTEGGSLTPDEIAEIRRLLKGQERKQWLLATLRIWAIWIAAFTGGVYAFLSILRDSVRALIGGDGQ